MHHDHWLFRVGIIFIQSDLLRDFGMFAAFAILGTTLFSLIFLPHMLGNNNKPIPFIIERISNYPLDRSKTLLIVVSVITIVCIFAFGIGGVNFDADMHNLGYQAKRVTHSEQLLRSKTFTGDKEKYFASSGKSMEIAINNFALLDHKLDSLQKPGIVKSYTHTSDIFVPLNVQKCRIEAWKKYWTKERLEKVHRLINETAPQVGLEPDGFEAFFDYATAEYEPHAMYKARNNSGWVSIYLNGMQPLWRLPLLHIC
jgi:predicted exporter